MITQILHIVEPITNSGPTHTRPEARSWINRLGARYENLGTTRRETCAGVGRRHTEIKKEDVEAAIAGLPLRLDMQLSRGVDDLTATWTAIATADFENVSAGHKLVVKVSHAPARDSKAFFAESGRQTDSGIAFPIHQRHLPGAGLLSLLSYYPAGSLRDRNRVMPLNEQQIRETIRQLTRALTLMHGNGNDVLVHGDLKPENVLVSHTDPLTVVLTDFDHSQRVPKNRAVQHHGIFTLMYAAPETLTGQWNHTSDIWSLGMMALEFLTGSHPFEGLDDSSIRTLLSGDWEFPEEGNDWTDAWRAFLLGSLNRNVYTRWGPRELTLWMDNDPATIASALALSRHVSSADTAFLLNGRNVYTAHDMARALVADWATGISALHNQEFIEWLHTSFPELAARLQMLHNDPLLNDDARLVRFAYFSFTELTPLWRNVELSAAALDRLAQRALQGDADAYQMLSGLRDSSIADSYLSVGVQAPGALIGDWAAGWRRYETGWQRLLEAGAPNSRPPDEAAFPALVRLWLSEAQRQQLTSRAEERCRAIPCLLRRHWYFALGHDLTGLTVEHQWILDSLDSSSLAETLTYSHRMEDLAGDNFRRPPEVTDERLGAAVLFSDTTARLTRNLALDWHSLEQLSLHGAPASAQTAQADPSDDFGTRITAPVGSGLRTLLLTAWEWITRLRPGGNRPAAHIAGRPAQAPETSISAHRVNLVLPGRTGVPLGQAALVRWSLPANSHLAIHVGHLGLFGMRMTRQRIVRLPYRRPASPAPGPLVRLLGRRESVDLPARGQIVLASFQPSLVWIRFRMPHHFRTAQTQPLRLGTPSHSLRPAGFTLSEPNATLLSVARIPMLAITSTTDAFVAIKPIDVSLSAFPDAPPLLKVTPLRAETVQPLPLPSLHFNEKIGVRLLERMRRRTKFTVQGQHRRRI